MGCELQNSHVAEWWLELKLNHNLLQDLLKKSWASKQKDTPDYSIVTLEAGDRAGLELNHLPIGPAGDRQ